MEQVSEEEVLELILEGKSYKEISEVLQSRYNHIQRGLSERSVRRFVSKAGLKDKQKAFLDEEIRAATDEVSRSLPKLIVKFLEEMAWHGKGVVCIR